MSISFVDITFCLHLGYKGTIFTLWEMAAMALSTEDLKLETFII